MSSLTLQEKRHIESLLGMSSGYVLNYSDRRFAELFESTVGIQIHSMKYSASGTSKANHLRCFWNLESDTVVGIILGHLLDEYEFQTKIMSDEDAEKLELCRYITSRLHSCNSQLNDLKDVANHFNANYLADQIHRIEQSINADPALAIGTAKELVETCCKTILSERGKVLQGNPEISELTKATLKILRLVPEDIPDSSRGADIIKRLLQNLGTIGNNMAELRNLYGTGHGKHGASTGLTTRHAKLAVGSCTTLVTFLFETHLEQLNQNQP